MRFFLLVYDKQAGVLREERSFDACEQARAVDQRRDLMLRYRLDPNIEIALFGSESREDLVKTHSRYFKSLAELARST